MTQVVISGGTLVTFIDSIDNNIKFTIMLWAVIYIGSGSWDWISTSFLCYIVLVVVAGFKC